MEKAYPHLSNAPITEALIDIQTNSIEPISIDALNEVTEAIKAEFPIIEPRHLATINFNVNGAESSGSREPNGFVVRSEDRLYAAQIMANRFSLSRLTPYKDWEDLYSYTERVWSIYREIIKPERIKRLAVRYINRLLLPDPNKDLSYYFTKPLDIPAGLPQGFANYLTRMVIPEPESGSVAIVQQSMEGITPEEMTSIIFDTDTFMEVDLAVTDNDKVLSVLEGLRDYKNRIFFNSLTNNTIELYK